MIYTVTCNPSLDYYLYVDSLQSSGIYRAKDTDMTYGGKGVNVSAVLTRMGAETTALGFVAGKAGQMLCERLDAEGIVHDFITLPEGETRINVKLRAEQELDVNAAGPAIPEAAWDVLLRRLDTLTDCDALVLAGNVPGGETDRYERILARAKTAYTVVDAEGDLLRRTLPYRPFLIKPNVEELGALFGCVLHTAEEIVVHARLLQQEGARHVLVSRGGDGALLVCEGGAVFTVEAAKGRVRNTVGCGDSMVAGFLSGWSITGDPATALRIGAACGSATAFSERLATMSEISRIAGQLVVTQDFEITANVADKR